MKWIDDMTLAPRNSEWVLGAIPLDDDCAECGLISEVIIFDGGVWTDTSGRIVNPKAWARIQPYKGRPAKYDWEDSLASLCELFEPDMPDGFILMGIAVGNVETGEGALIWDADAVDTETRAQIVWNADVLKDILGDVGRAYDESVSEMRAHF